MNTAAQHILGAATAAGLIFASLALTAPKAEAKEALWARTQFWEITGDYAGYCRATAIYGNTTMISIGVGKGIGWTLGFADTTAKPMVRGETYNIRVAASNGAYGTLVGTAFDSKMLFFDGLTTETVINLAKARSIVISDFGRFNLKGSYEAIMKTVDCYRAITGKAA